MTCGTGSQRGAPSRTVGGRTERATTNGACWLIVIGPGNGSNPAEECRILPTLVDVGACGNRLTVPTGDVSEDANVVVPLHTVLVMSGTTGSSFDDVRVMPSQYVVVVVVMATLEHWLPEESGPSEYEVDDISGRGRFDFVIVTSSVVL